MTTKVATSSSLDSDFPGALVQFRLTTQDFAPGAVGNAAEPEQQRTEYRDPYDPVGRDLDIADVDRDRLEDFDQVIQQAEQMQQQQRDADQLEHPSHQGTADEIVDRGDEQQQHRNGQGGPEQPVLIQKRVAEFGRDAQQHDGGQREDQVSAVGDEAQDRMRSVGDAIVVEDRRVLAHAFGDEEGNRVDQHNDGGLGVGFRLRERGLRRVDGLLPDSD